ncbi:hypothetical protein INT46_007778 [Mucor plumbeus]|uniref:CST complex subunit CTC1 n=1 Tax=Mucor plumbeus TaxID=97098 RepID=A0A8H7R079_9FUNG|nr:hypothetical protein INT46_007778 [Mucor plumbeus]
MTDLNVNDLKNYISGTTSSIVKASLIGVLTIVTNEEDEFPRGTVLLLDLVTNDPVVCFVDRTLPRALETTVQIRKWNCVNLKEGDNAFYIEFRLEDVYSEKYAKKCMLREQFSSDRIIFKESLRRQMEYYTPGDALQLTPPQSRINMVGIVYAISTLYLEDGKPAKFYLQITSNKPSNDTTTKLKAINVIFSGNDMIKYYRYFQIGGAFAFHNLVITSIHINDHTSINALSFNNRSNCQAIKYSHLEKTRRSSPVNNTSDHPLTITTVNTHKTYTGIITRVIDSMFGIYELDSSIIVCLFHLFSYIADMPFRINTRICLHHFHAVVINPKDGETSYLLQNFWNAPETDEGYMTLTACVMSHISILKFPDHCDDFTETTKSFVLSNDTDIGSQIKMYTYSEINDKRSVFTQLLGQLEIYAALAVKFVDTNIVKDLDVFIRAFNTIQHQVYGRTKTREIQASDLLNNFFLHDTVCLLVGDQNFRMEIDSYPSLNKIKNNLEDNLEDYQLDLAGGNTMFEKENVLTQKGDYDQTAEYFILGMLQVAQDGRMYLVDSETRILFVLAAYSSLISRRAGEIYLVRRLQMFREDLSFVENEDEDFIKRKDLSVSYFACQAKDLMLLDGDYGNNTAFHILGAANIHNRELKKLSLNRMPHEIRNIPKDHQYLAVHVVTRYPVEVCFTPNGSIYLECRVVVKMHEIEGIGSTAASMDYIKTTGSEEYILIFSSLKKTLHLHLNFQVDSYWIIYGLDKPGSMIKSIAENRSFAFSIDNEKHTIYPISFDYSTSNMVRLQPHYGETAIMPNPLSLIYDVSQLTDLNNLPPGLSSQITSLNYFEELINVQGVVIIKRFIEGYPTHSTLNKHALKLHNQLGVSTGKTNRKLFVQIRQPDSLDTISIYMDVHKVHYPIGMVIGSTVTFYNLIRKTKLSSNEELFFLANSSTLIHVNNITPSPDVISMKPAPIMTRLISSFLDPVLGVQDQSSKQIFKLYCYISSIIKLTLKWECRDCGSIVRNNDCYGMCEGASRVFSVHAFVQISDGTASANASIDGERLVFRLLQLSTNQIDALKNLVLVYGQLSYGGWGTAKIRTMDDGEERLNYDPEKDQRNAMHGYTLEDLCNNAKRAGQLYLYGQVQSKPTKKRPREEEVVDWSDNLIDEFKLRKFKISDNGSLLKTAELSKLKVKVVEIALPDARNVAYEMLNILNQTEIPVGSISSIPTPVAVSDFE